MISKDEQLLPSAIAPPRSPREEEQLLCNEALETGAYDAISDSEWVALCERAANKGRHVPEPQDAVVIAQ